MALLKNIVKLGLAKKAIDEARKPHNQERIKGLISSVRSKRSGGTSGPPR
jgi:hypothetical protein